MNSISKEMDLSREQEARLVYLFEQTFNFLVSQDIKFFLAFGTLIGALRHGRRMPWDDDIDIVISADDIPKLTSNLKKHVPSPKDIEKGYTKWIIHGSEKYVPGQTKENKHTEDGLWPGDLTLWKKDWGVPFKTYVRGRAYPFIYFYTYYIKDGMLTIPKGQMVSGHIKSFSDPVDNIFPLLKADYEGLTVPVPNCSVDLLKRQYGEDVFKSCKIQFNHKLKRDAFAEMYDEGDSRLTIPIEDLKDFNVDGHRWEGINSGIYCEELF